MIRLSERFVRTDPLLERDERRMVKYINKEIGDHVDTIVKRGFQRVIGTSGTILSLGGVVLQAETGSSVDRHPQLPRVRARACTSCASSWSTPICRSACRCPASIRAAPISRSPARVLLDTILRRLGAEDFTLCDLALREGLILDYIRRNKTHIVTIDQYPDIRRRSVEELGQRCNYWSDHARQVARLALALFDQTQPLHGLAQREREWLEYGALLHDVGVHISYKSHHKHSYYLIQHGDLRGFDRNEIEVIGLIARYHRQAHAEEVARGLRLAARAAAQHREGAVVVRAPRRRPRSQPRADRVGPRPSRIATTICCSG